MMDFIVSEIKDICHLSRPAYLRHLRLRNTVVHRILIKDQPVASVSQKRHLSPERSIIVVIIHKVQSSAVISQDYIEPVFQLACIACHIRIQLYIFRSYKGAHLKYDLLGVRGAIFLRQEKRNLILHIGYQADHLEFMFFLVCLLLIHRPVKVLNLRVFGMNRIGYAHWLIRVEIHIERLGVGTEWIVFYQHIAKRVLLRRLLLFQFLCYLILILHIVGSLNLLQRFFLRLGKLRCLRIRLLRAVSCLRSCHNLRPYARCDKYRSRQGTGQYLISLSQFIPRLF